MDLQEHVELLSRVDVFESLQKEEIREILSDLLQRNAEINLQAGEVFYTPQQPDGKLFILTMGRVRLYKMEASREFTLEVVYAGTVFGEVAFTPYAFTESYAEAMEPSVVFAMERAEVERLTFRSPR
jgi:CRP-like cAMP-binding protein